MPVLATPELNVTDTKLVNHFYPYSKQTAINIAFCPMSLIDKESAEKYIISFNGLLPEEKSLFMYVFSKGLTRDKGDDYAILNISPTGKTEDTREFVWIKHDYSTVIDCNSFVNFTYYDKGSFYTIQPQSFRSQLRSQALKEGKINRELLDLLIKEIYNSPDVDIWKESLSDMPLKSSKISIAKVLISMFPRLPMPSITALSDYIQSEIISEKDNPGRVDPNILELKGDIIVFFYNVHNYKHRDEGNLGGSCMKNNNNTEQIKFYANNPTNISVLTYIEDKKLLARAILWTDVRGKRYIDRVYCSTSAYATRLVAYCKQNKIDTIHSQTAETYGLNHTYDCVIKLDTFDMPINQYPYLDSMNAIDVVGGYIATDTSVLRKYMDTTNVDYIIKNLHRNGAMGLQVGRNERDVTLRKNGVKLESLQFPKDANGNAIQEYLGNYAIINKPKLALFKRESIVTINESEKVGGNWCEDVLIKKYNSLRPTLVYNPDSKEYTISYYDKQFVILSTYHKIFIRKTDAVYVNGLNTFVIKDVCETSSFKSDIKLLKLRKLYGGKLVRVTNEGLEEIRNQIKLLPFRESLMDIRKSRVYHINVKNILIEGIRIKGIIIPFKHLRFVKNESKNQE